MNLKLKDDTLVSNYKKRFPTPKHFVEWMLANPEKGERITSFEDRMKRLAEHKKHNKAAEND
ncbi:MAG: hypothetical protein U0X91_06745 [Spirosomataceae bacterium]